MACLFYGFFYFKISPLYINHRLITKEGCKWGHGFSAAIKLGSLEKTVIASLFHSGLQSGIIFFGKNDVICYSWEWRVMPFFDKKKTKKFYDSKLIFWSFATFLAKIILWSGAKQRFCFREPMSVLDQNGRIQPLRFLAWWQLTSHAINYNLP